MDFENIHHLRAATKQIRSDYLKGAIGSSISSQQAATTRDVPVKGPIWVSKFEICPSRDDNSRDLLLQLIDVANDQNIRYDRPESESLHLQWTGYRKDAGKNTPEPALLSETEKFQRLNQDVESPLTIFYIYGGSFVLNIPSNYRKFVGTLAHTTRSKVLMVRQRLAPQNPFPAALLDVFQAYLTLLAPPPNSPHQAVSPDSIVIAGDSSGSCLALGLLQVLLHLGRNQKSVNFHGKTITPSVPAGVALSSVVADLSNAMPSFNRNVKHDIFPVPIEKLPYLEKSFPTCSVWPTKPARANLYCEAGMLAHPLASPAASKDWSGSCPLWFASGQEQVVDGTRLIAQTAASQGVSVVLQEYEGMPHTFFLIFPKAPQTQEVLAKWTEAIVSLGKGVKQPSKAEFIRAKGLQIERLDLKNLVPFNVERAHELMRAKTLGYKVPIFHKEAQSSL